MKLENTIILEDEIGIHSNIKKVKNRQEFDALVQEVVKERKLKFSEQRAIAKVRKNEKILERSRAKAKCNG
jgi:hypothetical protein